MLQEEMQYAVPDNRGPEFLPDPCSLLPSKFIAAMLPGSARFALENLPKEELLTIFKLNQAIHVIN